jgi:hypothetical protein
MSARLLAATEITGLELMHTRSHHPVLAHSSARKKRALKFSRLREKAFKLQLAQSYGDRT